MLDMSDSVRVLYLLTVLTLTGHQVVRKDPLGRRGGPKNRQTSLFVGERTYPRVESAREQENASRGQAAMQPQRAQSGCINKHK